MDKERISNQVEIILQDLIPRLTGKNYNYKLKGKERRKLARRAFFARTTLQSRLQKYEYR